MSYDRVSFTSVDEISCAYTDGGVVLRRQVAKRVIDVSGPWATIAFAFRDRDASRGWGPVRISVHKWQRMAGRWRKQGSVNFRPDTARAIAVLFEEWGAMGDGLAELSA